MPDLSLYKINLDTPQPDGRKGESPRAAFTKVNDLIDALSSGIAGSIFSDTEPEDTTPYMEWVDTSVNPPVLLRRNEEDDDWVKIGSIYEPVPSYIPDESDFNAHREHNKALFAASGFVHYGKTYPSGANFKIINEGLWTRENSVGLLQVGRSVADSGIGNSETAFARANIAGVIFDLNNCNTTDIEAAQIKFPEAPNGTVTYDSSTGVVTTHADSTSAFSESSASSTVEVVVNRVDMFGFEFWSEEITAANPYVYKCGMVQSKAANINGVTTSETNRPSTYSAVYDGDISSNGLGVDFFAATEEQRQLILADVGINIYRTNDGKLIQWRCRQRTISGAGNGDFEGSTAETYLRFANTMRVKPQGSLDEITSSLAAYDVNESGFFAQSFDYKGEHETNTVGINIAHNKSNTNIDYGLSATGECYFLVCGTVPRLNQGAYHPSLNPNGTRYWQRQDLNSGGAWYVSTVGANLTTADAFIPRTTNDGFGFRVPTGYYGSPGGSANPEGKYYDVIYSSGVGGVIDYRLSAYDMGNLEELSHVDQQTMLDRFRGKEKLRYTRFNANAYYGYFSEENSSHALFKTGQASSGDIVTFYDNNMPAGTLVECYQPATGLVLYGVISSVDGYMKLGPTDYTWHVNSAHTTGLLNSNTTDVWYFAAVEFGVSVSGSFLANTVFSDPADIIARPELANGWLGYWGKQIPDGSSQGFLIPRKIVNTVHLPSNYWNGSSWVIASASTVATSNNLFNGANVSLPLTRIDVVPTLANAYLLKTSVQANLLHGSKGVLSVFAHNGFHDTTWANSMYNALTQSVGTSDTSNNPLQEAVVTTLSISPPTYKIDSNTTRQTSHAPLTLGGVSGAKGVKALKHAMSINGLVSLSYIVNELEHNGSDWGDTGAIIVNDSGVYTDANGNQCIASIKELSMPIGYTSNRARIGTQVKGVDL